jgi:hypothetical protein
VATAVALGSCLVFQGSAWADCADYAEFAAITGSVDTPCSAFRVAASDGIACIADGTPCGLQVIDVSNPESPQIVGSLSTGDLDAGAVAVAGTYAYVGAAGFGPGAPSHLLVVDIANPALPQSVGSVDVSGGPWGIVAVGQYVYVATYHLGLYVVDVSNPTSPQVVGHVDTPGEPRGLDVVGAYAYIADFFGGLQVIDVSNPASPVIVGNLQTPDEALGVRVSGHYAYVADRYSGLLVVDVSVPTSPHIAGGVDTPNEAWEIALVGHYAYVADGYSGVWVINISDPSNPWIVGGLDTPDRATGIVADEWVYVADGATGLLVLPLQCDSSVPTTYLVRPDGSGDFPTIQAAINAAAPGDVVELTDGTFVGDGNRDLDYHGKAITVRSQNGNPAVCIIDCEGGSTNPHRGFYFHSGEGAAALLEGITIRKGYTVGDYPYRCGAGILCYPSSSPTITNCIFSENVVPGPGCWYDGGGIYCYSSSSPIITDCVFTGNAAGTGGGLECKECSPTIINCVFRENSAAEYGGGMMASHLSHPVIRNCTFVNNSAVDDGGGLKVWNTTTVAVSNCTFVGNRSSRYGGGIEFENNAPGGSTIANTIIAFSAAGEAVACGGGASAPALVCCDLFGNAGGDWVGCIADQYGTNGNISANPLFCDAQQGDFTLHDDSPCAPGQTPGCDLIGALGVGCSSLVYADGSGFYPTIQVAVDATADGQAVLLANGIFRGPGNRDVDLRGKTITIRSWSGVVDSCVIDCQGSPGDPHRAFVFDSGEGNGTALEDLTIANGYAPGGDSRGGALLCAGTSPTITGCILRDNGALTGGAVFCGSLAGPVFQGCTFAGNVAEHAGAIACDLSAPRFFNCTFCSNEATASLGVGAGIESWNQSAPSLTNTIIAFSQAGQAIRCHEGTSATLVCCDIFGNAGGDWAGCIADQNGQDGNFSLDPFFCAAENGDYRLWNYSPCDQEGCGLIGAWPVGCEDPQAAGGEVVASGARLWTVPNPFVGGTTIAYRLGARASADGVSVAIYDVAGRMVRRLLAPSAQGVTGQLQWDGTDDAGMALPGGVYLLRLASAGRTVTERIIKVR